MTTHWSLAASLVLTFDNDEACKSRSKGHLDSKRWKAKMLHYFSILHAVCCESFFSSDGEVARLDILGVWEEDATLTYSFYQVV